MGDLLKSFNVETISNDIVLSSDAVPAPDTINEPTVSGNGTVSGDLVFTEDIEDDLFAEDAHSESLPHFYDTTVYYPSDTAVTVSVNNEVNPNDLISVNSVSLNVVSADGLSLNSVSVNVSNNYVSYNTVQVVSADNTPFWDKPFDQYNTSEGLLFIIMVTLVLGFISTHLLKGLRHYGDI